MTVFPRFAERPPLALLALLNAVRNGSVVPVTPDEIIRVLSGAGGDPSHMRALFGDVSMAALDRAAAAHGIPLDTVLDAYADARTTVAAANPELDAALDERGGWRRG
jgi:hypothetical protein